LPLTFTHWTQKKGTTVFDIGNPGLGLYCWYWWHCWPSLFKLSFNNTFTHPTVGLYCWYWWHCWPSLFKLSFNNTFTHPTVAFILYIIYNVRYNNTNCFDIKIIL
jgi:hypothetical protein